MLDTSNKGHFTYVRNDDIVPTAFHNWIVNDPDYWGVQDETCVEVFSKYFWIETAKQGVWNDQYCEKEESFLCEQVKEGN